MATVVFLAISFYIAYMGPQQAQLMLLFSVLGIQLLMLASMPQSFEIYSKQVSADYFIIASALGDIILVILFFYLDSRYPAHLAKKLE
jgi:hypothetical protein